MDFLFEVRSIARLVVQFLGNSFEMEDGKKKTKQTVIEC